MVNNKGFRIEIEEVEKIYEGFSQSGRFVLGETELPDPFTGVGVIVSSNGDFYASTTQLAQESGNDPILGLFGSPEKTNTIKPTPVPKQTLEDKFKINCIRDTVYILNSQDKPEYEIRGLKGGLDINLGVGSIPPKKIGTLEEFVVNLKEYKNVIETTVNGAYTESGAEKPDIILYWRPIIRMGQSVDQVRKEREGLKDKIAIEKPDITFEDIGGQVEAKRVIQGLSFALKNPGLYKKWGTHPPKGVLLHGPSGTGKTLMAKALAREADAKFYHVKVSDITSMWYGESEKLMQDVFDLAKENGNTIIFFDEIDALVPVRDHSHEASQRIVSTMLENLDGLESSEKTMVVGSTNRLGSVDTALLRPGRIDRLVEVPLPDEEGRKQIFEIHKRKAEKVAGRELFTDLTYKTLVKKTGNYSGADIAEILRRVLEEKVRQEGSGDKAELVKTEDMLKEIEKYERTKSVKKTMGFQVRKEGE